MCDRIILCVSGPDAKSFLQNLVTNDVTKLNNNIIYSALLTPQGKLVSDFFLIDSDQGILIDVNSKVSEKLLKLLTLYKLRAEVRIEKTDLKVMAPSALFRLESTDDPLLFVPLGNDYFYLIHKWGNDLKPLRKIRMWPFKNIWNLLLLIFGLSFLATELTPLSLFTKTPDGTSYWMLFFFMFKALASIVLFYGFALGKNFNPAIWNNKYNKA